MKIDGYETRNLEIQEKGWIENEEIETRDLIMRNKKYGTKNKDERINKNIEYGTRNEKQRQEMDGINHEMTKRGMTLTKLRCINNNYIHTYTYLINQLLFF